MLVSAAILARANGCDAKFDYTDPEGGRRHPQEQPGSRVTHFETVEKEKFASNYVLSVNCETKAKSRRSTGRGGIFVPIK